MLVVLVLVLVLKEVLVLEVVLVLVPVLVLEVVLVPKIKIFTMNMPSFKYAQGDKLNLLRVFLRVDFGPKFGDHSSES